MKFSVCICVYNKDNAQYFKEALESIINQSFLPAQIVLVVDGKIDESLQRVINNFKMVCKNNKIDFDITYFEKNKGHGEARRTSINKAKYNLIALMDADDICRYDRFKLQIEVFQKDNNISVVGGQIMEIDHKTKKPLGIRSVPQYDQEIKNYLKSRCPFNQMTVMFKKDDVIQAGNYQDFYHNEDYYLWIRMYLNNCKFYNIPYVLVDVRVNETFYMRRGGWKYFLSEFRLQKIMYKYSITSFYELIINVIIRFIIQVLLPDSLRKILFKNLFRKGIK